MIVAIDTNDFVSAVVVSTGTASAVIARCRVPPIVLVVSPPQLVELRDVLARPKFLPALGAQPAATVLLAAIDANAKVVDPAIVAVVDADPDDGIILGTALAGNADMLISGDRHLLSLRMFRGIEIVTPRQFLDRLEQIRALPERGNAGPTTGVIADMLFMHD